MMAPTPPRRWSWSTPFPRQTPGFVSLTTSAGACTAPPAGEGGTVACGLGTLAVGAPVLLSVTTDLGPASRQLWPLDSEVSVTTATPDPALGNNSPLGQGPRLRLPP